MKEIIYCSICGISSEETRMVGEKNKFNLNLCHKHYMQMYHTGRVNLRFRKSPNEIILLENHAEVILYNI